MVSKEWEACNIWVNTQRDGKMEWIHVILWAKRFFHRTFKTGYTICKFILTQLIFIYYINIGSPWEIGKKYKSTWGIFRDK